MLRSWKIVAISCLFAGIGLAQTATLAQAQSGDVGRAPASRLAAPAAVDTDAKYFQKAVSMYAADTQSVGSGFNAVDSMTIRCPKGHCRIEVTAYMQVQSAFDNNNVAVCITFDDLYGVMDCPYAAKLQIDDSYTGISTASGVYDVSKGNYEIGLHIYSGKGIDYTRYMVNAKSFTRKP